MNPRGACLLLLLLAGCSRGAPARDPREELAEALDAFARGDRAAAEASALRAAEAGEAAAECLLGIMEEDRDPERARLWFSRAADRGYPEADYRIGRMRERGRDLARARRAYERAAERGFVAAQYAFARMLLRGLGGPKDEAMARRLLAYPARLGSAPARLELGRLAERDGEPGAALFWYRLAERRGSPEAAEAARRLAGRLGARRAAPAERAAALHPYQ